MLSQEAIDEFKKLYKEHYGEELNDFVASNTANQLVRMFDAVYRPIPKSEEENYNKIKKEQEGVPEGKKFDYVKHLADDAKITEFKQKIGEKKFWELMVEANKKLNLKMRGEILKIVQEVTPFDELEKNHLAEVVDWIKSGAELFRIKKPDVPPKHLVSYFVLVDPATKKILLVAHIKAKLWLPAGGHVEPNENPKVTVEREIQEELNIKADFISEKPLLLTQTVTVGLTAGHTDVSLWYMVKGDSTLPLKYDPGEFNGYKWFSSDEILAMPIEKLDPHLHRFVKKLASISN